MPQCKKDRTPLVLLLSTSVDQFAGPFASSPHLTMQEEDDEGDIAAPGTGQIRRKRANGGSDKASKRVGVLLNKSTLEADFLNEDSPQALGHDFSSLAVTCTFKTLLDSQPEFQLRLWQQRT